MPRQFCYVTRRETARRRLRHERQDRLWSRPEGRRGSEAGSAAGRDKTRSHSANASMRFTLPGFTCALLLGACSPENASDGGPATGGAGGGAVGTGGTVSASGAGASSVGGSSTGGATTGGTATGGTATGGSVTGGTATGGSAPAGGTATGGATAGSSGHSSGGGGAHAGESGAGGVAGSGSGGTGGSSGGGGGGATAGTAGAAPCSPGKAIEFDGDAKTRMDASVGDAMPLNNDSRTVEMWVYTVPKSWRAEHHLYQYGGTNPREGAFGIDFGDGPYPDTETYTNGTGDNHFKVPVATVKETGWFHFAMVWDGPTKTLKGVINGVTVGKKTITAALTTSKSSLSIGYSPSFSGNGGFTGKIDEFRVWKVARSDADIASTMNQHLRGDEANLVVYFPFDEGTGTTSKDLVGGFEATFGNTAPKWAASEVELNCP
jgi:hypothetical protein